MDRRDRVRENAPEEINARIDRETGTSVCEYAARGLPEIGARIAGLDCEWDAERVLETNAAALAPAALRTASYATAGGSYFPGSC